jgi:Asp-tRNA(Asn)/Glu-tRNA(Gln) amidotransferase A subunit family amidase
MSVRDAMVFYQWPANLLGWPSISVPTPQFLGGLPASVMLTGKAHTEARLLAIAQAFECFQKAR